MKRGMPNIRLIEFATPLVLIVATTRLTTKLFDKSIYLYTVSMLVCSKTHMGKLCNGGFAVSKKTNNNTKITTFPIMFKTKEFLLIPSVKFGFEFFDMILCIQRLQINKKVKSDAGARTYGDSLGSTGHFALIFISALFVLAMYWLLWKLRS